MHPESKRVPGNQHGIINFHNGSFPGELTAQLFSCCFSR